MSFCMERRREDSLRCVQSDIFAFGGNDGAVMEIRQKTMEKRKQMCYNKMNYCE